MSGCKRNRAFDPNDLEKLFVSRANARDIDGLVSLYEQDAVVRSGDGRLLVGMDDLARFFTGYLATRPALSPSDQLAALSSGDLALTASRHDGGEVSVEIARRQPDGSWLWVVDRFSVGKLVPAAPRLRHWLP